MNKKDFWSLISCDIGILILLIETYIGLELSLQCLCTWTIVSMIIHIIVLKDYVITRA